MNNTITVHLNFEPGEWRNPQQWTATVLLPDGSAVVQVAECLAELKEWAQTFVPQTYGSSIAIAYKYGCKGVDYTTQVNRIESLRKKDELAHAAHMQVRLATFLAMRERGLTLRAIGEMFELQQSTIAMALRQRRPSAEE